MLSKIKSSEKVFFEDVGDRRGEMRKLSSGNL